MVAEISQAELQALHRVFDFLKNYSNKQSKISSDEKSGNIKFIENDNKIHSTDLSLAMHHLGYPIEKVCNGFFPRRIFF
jgi:hypothetical protein